MTQPEDLRQPRGAIGEFPNGKLNEHDQGAIEFGIAHSRSGNVVINFGQTSVQWLALPPEIARQFAASLIHHAEQAERITKERG